MSDINERKQFLNAMINQHHGGQIVHGVGAAAGAGAGWGIGAGWGATAGLGYGGRVASDQVSDGWKQKLGRVGRWFYDPSRNYKAEQLAEAGVKCKEHGPNFYYDEECGSGNDAVRYVCSYEGNFWSDPERCVKDLEGNSAPMDDAGRLWEAQQVSRTYNNVISFYSNYKWVIWALVAIVGGFVIYMSVNSGSRKGSDDEED